MTYFIQYQSTAKRRLSRGRVVGKAGLPVRYIHLSSSILSTSFSVCGRASWMAMGFGEHLMLNIDLTTPCWPGSGPAACGRDLAEHHPS
jgi:hypothetical protein